ncbi:hypothetical protein SASPL_114080 [Salvia splendens]|uniref:RING-type domain-containing protein n=1 Tax=Salvia splendens TaxID=180675 RepID=A0A8X8Y5A4_SALSN|nr:hypothetical protein SASPL_114080 [Salvia splendens]
MMHASGGTSVRRRSFRDSIKLLEADIQHANTLASDFPCEYDGACLQMRMSYSPAAHFFLFLVQWSDCRLAGALGLLRILIYKVSYCESCHDHYMNGIQCSVLRLLRILIYKVYVDGATTMSTHERKASIREFYAVIYPSLLQLQSGVTDSEDERQKAVWMERYRRRDEEKHEQCSEVNLQGEEECGICMEMRSKVLLPNCNHEMCLKCYREWRSRSQSCPFCRDSLKRVNSGDLWIFLNGRDVIDMSAITSENLKRLFTYVDKLPLIIPDTLFNAYNKHISSIWELKWFIILLVELSECIFRQDSSYSY